MDVKLTLFLLSLSVHLSNGGPNEQTADKQKLAIGTFEFEYDQVALEVERIRTNLKEGSHEGIVNKPVRGIAAQKEEAYMVEYVIQTVKKVSEEFCKYREEWIDMLSANHCEIMVEAYNAQMTNKVVQDFRRSPTLLTDEKLGKPPQYQPRSADKILRAGVDVLNCPVHVAKRESAVNIGQTICGSFVEDIDCGVYILFLSFKCKESPQNDIWLYPRIYEVISKERFQSTGKLPKMITGVPIWWEDLRNTRGISLYENTREYIHSILEQEKKGKSIMYSDIISTEFSNEEICKLVIETTNATANELSKEVFEKRTTGERTYSVTNKKALFNLGDQGDEEFHVNLLNCTVALDDENEVLHGSLFRSVQSENFQLLVLYYCYKYSDECKPYYYKLLSAVELEQIIKKK